MAPAYWVLGFLIVALPVMIWFGNPPNWKFWAETAVIWVFGCYWWLKTHELEAIK